MTARPSLLGAVLVGGASRRYGKPKWRVPVLGVSMGRRAVDALAPLVERVVVIGGDGEAARERGLEGRGDLRPGAGPLGGIHTALPWAEEMGVEGALVLGCDMPLVTAGVLGGVVALGGVGERGGDVRGGARGGAELVVPVSERGLEPLCALYPVGVVGAMGDALERGERSIHAVLEALGPRTVSVEELARAAGVREPLLNVNTPPDRMRAEALLHPGPPIVCVVGKKNSGKTGLTVALAAELARRGHRVMTVKHGHGFDLDRRGTDSWRHRHEGGAERTLLVGPDDLAMVGGWGADGERPLRELVDGYLSDADIVVAEGWKVGPDPKVEVYRAAAHAEPLLGGGGEGVGEGVVVGLAPGLDLADTFLAVVTDRDDHEPGVPVFRLGDGGCVTAVADLAEEVLLG